MYSLSMPPLAVVPPARLPPCSSVSYWNYPRSQLENKKQSDDDKIVKYMHGFGFGTAGKHSVNGSYLAHTEHWADHCTDPSFPFHLREGRVRLKGYDKHRYVDPNNHIFSFHLTSLSFSWLLLLLPALAFFASAAFCITKNFCHSSKDTMPSPSRSNSSNLGKSFSGWLGQH